MQKKKYRSIIFIAGTLIVLGIILVIGIVSYVRTNPNEARIVEFDNAPCVFEKYPGVLTVEEIRSNSSKNTEKDILIIYQFDPGKVTNPPHVKKDEGEIETTTAEIKRLNIKPGKQFQTDAEYIKSGFCRPGPNVKDSYTWK